MPKSSTLAHPQVEVESSVSMYHEGEPTMTKDERAFRKAFFDMTKMVKVLYEERNLKMQVEISRPPRGEGYLGGGGHEDGRKPPSTPPSSSPPSIPSSLSYSISTTFQFFHPHTSKGTSKSPLLKIDVKFELPTYNGKVNAEKLDNWIHQLEFYCRIQNLQKDDIKIQLASLRMEDTTLFWWEARTQYEIKNHGKNSMH